MLFTEDKLAMGKKKNKLEIKLQIHRVLQSWGDLSA